MDIINSIITSTIVHVFAAAGIALLLRDSPLMALQRERGREREDDFFLDFRAEFEMEQQRGSS